MLVTALVTQQDGKTTHPINTYYDCLEKLVTIDLPILLFYSSKLQLPDSILRPNVILRPIDFEGLPLYHYYLGCKTLLPAHGNPQKDTFDYLVIQNSKTFFAASAAHTYPAEPLFMWVDAGLLRIMQDVEAALEMFKVIHDCPEPRITIPGCNGWPARLVFDSVNWYFCGGLFVGKAPALIEFHSLCMDIIVGIRPYITWEVNIWAEVARHRPELFNRYLADHNDSILANY